MLTIMYTVINLDREVQRIPFRERFRSAAEAILGRTHMEEGKEASCILSIYLCE